MLRKEGATDGLIPSREGPHRWPFQYLEWAVSTCGEIMTVCAPRPTAKAIQPELVDSVDGLGILPVVLYQVEIVGCGE